MLWPSVSLPSMATTSTPNFSTNSCTHCRKHCSNSFGLIFLEYSSKRIWAGIPVVVLETSTTTLYWVHTLQYLQPCALNYYCQNSDDIGSSDILFFPLLGLLLVWNPENLLVMSKLSTLNSKKMFRFSSSFFFSKSCWHYFWACCGLNLTLARIVPVCFQPYCYQTSPLVNRLWGLYATVLAGTTNSKYALLKKWKRLNEQQKNKLSHVSVAPVLGECMNLKKFRGILKKSNDWLERII